jgi:hypothetical protein
MSHSVPGLPPFSPTGEKEAHDPAFEKGCVEILDNILRQDADIRIKGKKYSLNEDYGIVLRADFRTPDDNPDTVNRVMVWKAGDGQLVKFVGFCIPSHRLI